MFCKFTFLLCAHTCRDYKHGTTYYYCIQHLVLSITGWLKTSASNGALMRTCHSRAAGEIWRFLDIYTITGADYVIWCFYTRHVPNIPISDWPHDTTEETSPGQFLFFCVTPSVPPQFPGIAHPVTPWGKTNHNLPLIIHDPIHTREECLIPLYGQVSLLASCFISSLELSNKRIDHWSV